MVPVDPATAAKSAARNLLGMRQTVPAPDPPVPMSCIVIYEQDDLMRALLEEWLRGAGYRVHGVSTIHSAPVQEDADLVIVSLYMPKHTGARLVSEIRAAYPLTPLVAISAQFRAGLSTAGATAQTLGVAQVIAKPLTRDALLATVRAMIGAPN